EPFDFALCPAVVVDAFEVKEGEGEEAAGMRLVERFEGLLDLAIAIAIEIDNQANARLVHLFQIAGYAFLGQKVLAVPEVVMHVEHGKCRLFHDSRLGDHHRARLPVAEFQVLDVRRLRGERASEVVKDEGDEDRTYHGNSPGLAVSRSLAFSERE